MKIPPANGGVDYPTEGGALLEFAFRIVKDNLETDLRYMQLTEKIARVELLSEPNAVQFEDSIVLPPRVVTSAETMPLSRRGDNFCFRKPVNLFTSEKELAQRIATIKAISKKRRISLIRIGDV